ncbi:MAG: hypothetical protein LBI28_08845 [Treponema sp.]|jgi:hypothetical protein|nr:hypothetical protein [Treponema sp.]
MELMFVIICGIAIFLTPIFTTGECSKIKYIIKMLIVSIIETFFILWIFSSFVPDGIWADTFNIVLSMYSLLYVYNTVITVKRCRSNCLKKYNLITPFLQFVKLFMFCCIVAIGSMGDGLRVIWFILIFWTTIINIVQVTYLSTYKIKDHKLTNNENMV